MFRREQRPRIAPFLLAGALLPAAAIADTVHLKNGEVFEGVEAVVTGDTVKIDLPIGSMRLPMSKVASIDEADSTLGEYRARESRLGQERADAAGWLELANWSRSHGYGKGTAKAALAASRLDPELPDLEPVMASLGYVLDEKAHEWVLYGDAMRRRGLVEDRGEWVTPEERHARARDAAPAPSDEPRSRADDHLDKALDILAAAVNKPDAPATTTVIVQQPANVGAGFGWYPGFGGGVIGDPGLGGGLLDAAVRTEINTAWDQLARRQPASFIPMTSSSPRRLDPVTHRFVR